MKKLPFILIFICLALVISCSPIENSVEGTDQLQPNKYNHSFTRGGYYIRYDGIHYKYRAHSDVQIKEIIKYYYPDCFDVVVYGPGSPETGYLSIFYATWKSYLSYVEIK